jgi:uncharacterized membrane protein YgaE (UPF0421/DUF939 family)
LYLTIGKKKIPLPGFRNIKTAIAVFVCIVFYEFTGRDNLLFAATAALICMQGSMERTFASGMNRVAGTMIGGVAGICFNMLKTFNFNYYVWSILVCIGLILIIYFLNLNNRNDSLIMACFVFLVITLDPSLDRPEYYAVNRILDTTFGIIISIGVNHFLFRPEHDRQQLKDVYEKDRNFRYRIKRSANHKTTNWSGGVSTELLIYPERAFFSERNFIWHFSSSTNDYRETTFSVMNGYKRHLLLLSGNAKIIQGTEAYNMTKYESVSLNTEEMAKCIGLCTDLKLMVSDAYEAELKKYHCQECHAIKSHNLDKEPYHTKLIYSLYDDLEFRINIDENEKFEVILNKGDLFILENINELSNDASITVHLNGKAEFDVVAIAAIIRNKK